MRGRRAGPQVPANHPNLDNTNIEADLIGGGESKGSMQNDVCGIAHTLRFSSLAVVVGPAFRGLHSVNCTQATHTLVNEPPRSFLFAGASEGPGRVLVSSMGTAATSVAGRAAERRLAASRPPPSRSKKTIMNACTYVTNSHEYGNGNFTEARYRAP